MNKREIRTYNLKKIKYKWIKKKWENQYPKIIAMYALSPGLPSMRMVKKD